MRPTCNASSQTRRVRRFACTSGIATFLLCACGQREGVVGRQHTVDAATSAARFESEFVTNAGLWNVETALAGASVNFGVADASARDGNIAELVFPGDAARSGTDSVGPDYVTQLSTRDRFGFGTLRSRLNFGGCSGTEEVVQAVLGYFSDGADHDGNGITDDIEIDLQITCGAPRLVYLSVYTDYQATPSGEQVRKLSHIVDLSTGAEYDTPRDDSDTFVQSGTTASLARPNLATTGAFYEIGYEWHVGSVRFFINDGGQELTLWTLADPSHVPQQPVYLTYNLWHPASHWFPNLAEADFPANNVVMKVDWISFEPSAN